MVVAVLGLTALVLVAGIAMVARRRLTARKTITLITGSFLAFNGLLVLVPLILLLSSGEVAAQQPGREQVQDQQQQVIGGGMAIGAALATGLAAIGAGIAVGGTGAAAIGSITEKPEILGRSLIYVGLAEGIAIYGLIISFMILTGGFGG